MVTKLKTFADKYEALKEQLYDPEVAKDLDKSRAVNQELSDLEETYELYQYVKKRWWQRDEATKLLQEESDEDIIDLAKMQLEEAEEKLVWINKKIQLALLPKDPNDKKDIYLEIRPAAWWDESGLFAAELMRMYLIYAEKIWWTTDIIEHDTTWIGWLKFATIKITWNQVYSKLKFESWVHRVQRIPDTESKWRVHTSTVTVAAMPEVDDVEIDIDKNDVEMDTFAASSSGWQHANKNQTWVRLHHKPTGLIVMGTDSKSQLKNKENAWKMLKARLHQLEIDKQQQEQKEKRFDQVWSWGRSEKIRTYNFPQDRVTDHRIKQSRPNIPAILDWEIDEIIKAVIVQNQIKMLENLWAA